MPSSQALDSQATDEKPQMICQGVARFGKPGPVPQMMLQLLKHFLFGGCTAPAPTPLPPRTIQLSLHAFGLAQAEARLSRRPASSFALPAPLR